MSWYPGTGYLFLELSSLVSDGNLSAGPYSSRRLGGNTTSRVSFKQSSIMRGRRTRRSALDSSRHGFVLTSMSQGFRASSMMKSYPKISMQCLRPAGFSFPSTARRVSLMISVIGPLMRAAKSQSRRAEPWEIESWLPSSKAP